MGNRDEYKLLRCAKNKYKGMVFNQSYLIPILVGVVMCHEL